MKRRLFLAALLWPATARAHSYKAGDIAIGHAWALPSNIPDGQVFMPLANLGKSDDALVGARSDICSFIELRRNARYDDPPETQFSLPPGKPFPMRPQAAHLRLVGLARPLALDERFTMVLDFLNNGEAEIEIHVEHAPGD
ncbi:MAG: copper chaperone PCu(A)C [Proteobacteria bacterium]|nr:copper chaperone PCu(A)C [Pseudomonadota bacterium]